MKIHISLKSKWVKAVGIAITAVSFLYLIKTLLSMHLDRISSLQHPVLTIALLLALAICYVGVVYLSAAAWRLVLCFIGRIRPSFQDTADVYVKANIAKYLPGNFMHFAGRNLLAKKLSFDQVDVAFSSVLEIVMLLVTALVWSVILSFHAAVSVFSSLMKRSSLYLPIAAAVIVVLFILLYLFLRRRGLLKKYRRFFTRDFLKFLPRLFVLYSLTMVIPGLFLAFILGALGTGASLLSVPTVLSAYMISWVAGYIVIGSPGGLGVRESVMVLMLGTAFGSDTALLAALLLRATSVVGDVIAYLLQVFLSRHRLRRQTD